MRDHGVDPHAVDVALSAGDGGGDRGVTRVRQILEGLGLEIATPDEARNILALKGGDKVGF